jgi:phosphoribosylglycinamide formyltransferase 1
MRLAIFASGSGSNAEALMQAAEEREAPFSIELVVSNRMDAGVLDRAERFGIASRVLSPGEVADSNAILSVLREREVDAVALAGYLKMIPAEVVDAYRHRMLNVHPALLPSFGGHGMYGRNVHRAVIEAGVRWSGATVHLVDREYDTGPIVLQQIVPVEPDDSPETLAERVLEAEHVIYPLAVRLLAEDRLVVDGRRVRILDHPKQDIAS